MFYYSVNPSFSRSFNCTSFPTFRRSINVFMKLSNRHTLGLILVVAAILRFFHFSEIPFTHDEFSALFRLDFSTFSDLIEKGVMVDFHPAGVQVFLYYYTHWFGTQEWVVKLPFALMGLGSVWYMYKLGKLWFHETAGLLSAALLASIQYAVMYSQIARPYISGLFFSLTMVYFWSQMIKSPQKGFLKNGILYVLSAALCAYNHHFSLLFVFIVGLTGVFMVEKEYRWRYIFFGLAVFVTYIPHLKVLFYQLSKGGVEGWLAKPNSDFFSEYLFYTLNYSWPMAAALALLTVYGMVSKSEVKWRWIVISIVWFATPLSIGYFYSLYVNAVLQFSVLIFSFPFLLLLLFGSLPRFSEKTNFLWSLLIVVLGTYSLIETRRHYSIFYESVYEKILTDLQSAKSTHNPGIYLVDSHQEITEYYLQKDLISDDFLFWSDRFKSLLEFKQYLLENHTNHEVFYLGCLSNSNAKIVPIIQEFYPYLEFQHNYFGGTTYLFSKNKISRNSWPVSDETDPESKEDLTTVNFSPELEWGPSATVNLNSVIDHPYQFIDLSVEVTSSEKLDQGVLVSEIWEGDQKIFWGGSDFSDFALPFQGDTTITTVYQTLKLSDIQVDYSKARVKAYVWNKGKKSFIARDLKIKVRRGNPIIYGLYYPLWPQ